MTHPYFKNELKVIAHRGDSVNFPENTMQSFLSAAEMGVDCIETDVHLTKDGVCVIWHDDTLERLTGNSEPVTEKTYDELMELDAGEIFTRDNGETFPFRNRGIRIATLEEVLKNLPDMRFNIDLKNDSRKLVEEFTRIIRYHKAENRVMGASFHYNCLNMLRDKLPEIPTSFSEKEIRRIIFLNKTGLLNLPLKMKGAAVQIPEYSSSIKVVTGKLVRALHRKGIQVHVWTVNSREDMLRLLGIGVDAIITDSPRLLQAAVREYSR